MLFTPSFKKETQQRFLVFVGSFITIRWRIVNGVVAEDIAEKSTLVFFLQQTKSRDVRASQEIVCSLEYLAECNECWIPLSRSSHVLGTHCQLDL